MPKKHKAVEAEGLRRMLSQKTRYALKAMLELAALSPGATLSSAEISARRTIPAKFLESILVELKRGGLVRGQRGRSGGYWLAGEADEISFGDVVRLMEGPLSLIPCASVTHYRRCTDCSPTRACELQKIFRVLRDSTATILDGRSLADPRGNAGQKESRVSASTAKRGRPGKAPAIRKRAAKTR